MKVYKNNKQALYLKEKIFLFKIINFSLWF